MASGLIAFSLSLLAVGLVLPYSILAGDVTVDRGTITSGGNVSAKSSTQQISGALGQVVVGEAQSTTNIVESGVWTSLTCDCRFHGDPDANGTIDIFDVVQIVDVAFRGGSGLVTDPHCPHLNRGDVSCDGMINVFDVAIEVAAAFRGEDARCTPCNK